MAAPQLNDETRPEASLASGNRQPPRPESSARKPVAPNTRQVNGGLDTSHPSPPDSASPRDLHHHQNGVMEALAASGGGRYARSRLDQSETSAPISSRQSIAQSSDDISNSASSRRRGSSLTSRFEGDQSHRPLDILRRESKKAHRSPHLRKKHLPGADTIDKLDTAGGYYHHEGPFDAALLSRNLRTVNSPVAALQSSNAEALKATPQENIKDSVERHRPLDGVAFVPPGLKDAFGRTYNYEEGADLQREEGGDMGRWPGIKYLPEDLKGKGEPSYTIEKALKDDKKHGHRRIMSDGVSGYEMTPRSARPHSSELDGQHRRSQSGQSGWQSEQRRSDHGSVVTEGLTRRPVRRPVAT